MHDRPTRRHSPAVYRRRRLTLAVLVIFVAALLWWLTSLAVDALFEDEEPGGQGASQSEDDADSGSGEENGSAAPTDSSSADQPGSGESASPDEETEGTGQCAPEDIEVRASTGADSYSRTDAPLLIMEVENTSSSDCTVDLGTGAQEFSLEHENQQIFSTAQCAGDETTLETDLEPGDVESSHLTWPLSDSSEDCSEPADVPSGEYELTVDLDGNRSEPASFMLGDG